jgi:Fungal Zn(2)-Cys(6) binuclear cluster domain
MASSSPPVTQGVQSRRNAHTVKRKALNCLPCRQHKLRCDRHVPCSNCRRSKRDDLCRRHPAPAPRRHTEPRVVHAYAETVNPSSELSSHRRETLPRSTPSHQVYQSESIMEASAISGESGESQDTNNNSSIQPPFASAGQVSSFLHKSARRVSNLHMLRIYDELEVQRTQQRPGAVEEGLTDAAAPPTLIPSNAMQTQIPTTTEFLTAAWDLGSSERELFWKRHLSRQIPTQNQCDVLISYYVENINWIFQSIHVPSFRKDYAQFWSTNVDDIDLIWLSLLYTIISVSGLYIPAEAIRITGIHSSNIRSLAQTWHSASRQALHASDFEARSRLTQLQTFSITQLYWYATNKVETLNS